MENNFKQTASPASLPLSPPADAPTDALAWACDVLDLDAEDQTLGKKETRRQAMKSFFNRLRSNDFRAEEGTAAAAEVICGKQADLVPVCLRGQKKKQFQQLDDLVEWYASQLGEQDNQQLLAGLSRRLSSFNTDAVSAEVKSYGKQIWQSASSMKPLVSKQDLASLKVFQGLFHISTIRPSKRRQVRTQHVGALREKFSTAELTSAKRFLRLRHLGAKEWLHRPFLSLLTCDRDQIENYRIGQPVASGAQTVAYAKNFGSTKPAASANTQEEPKSSKTFLTVFIVISVISVLIRVGAFSSRNSSNRPNKPNIRYNVPNPGSSRMRGTPGMPGASPSPVPDRSIDQIVEMIKHARELEDARVTSAEAEFLDPGSSKGSRLDDPQKMEKALEQMRQRSLERMRQIREKSEQRPSAPRPFGPDANIGSGRPGSANSGSGASDPFKTVDEVMKRQAESQKQFEKSVEQAKKNLNPFDSMQMPIARPKSLQDPFGNKPYRSRDRSGKWGRQ